jgi:signal transduction histidine kinase
MGRLIDDLLKLSRVTRVPMAVTTVDLSDLARAAVAAEQAAAPERAVEVVIAEGLSARGDEGLLRIALHNLVSNAWKFTSKRAQPRIEVGSTVIDERPAFFVRDNGAGFDRAHAGRLFEPFYRLHRATEFEGTGVGLATVSRIVRRHGGKVWAESALEHGATFFWTLPHST